MAELLLPSLNQDGDVPEHGDRIGEWVSVGFDALNNISRALSFDEISDPDYSEVSSIPDMWARPLLFEMALCDPDHPIHEQIRGEWRGLLTMLALKERRNIDLTMKSIDILDDNEDLLAFLRALQRKLPQTSVTEDTKWSNLHLICSGKGENPIGITSPSTFVCTSVYYGDYVKDVSWYDGSRLIDPLKVTVTGKKLDDEEKASVANWLTNLASAIEINVNDTAGRVSEQIANFSNELTEGLSAPLRDEYEVTFSENRLFASRDSLFQGMEKPIRDKDYFTENLYVINQKDAFKGADQPTISNVESSLTDSENMPVTPIYPINAKMLNDGLDINLIKDKDGITFEQMDTNRIAVKLKTPVGPKERVYAYEPDSIDENPKYKIVLIQTVPVLEIWPDFETDNWKAYYTYCGRKRGEDLFYAKPLLQEGVVSENNSTDGDNYNEITKTSSFPKVMQCFYKKPRDSEFEDAGVLLISPRHASLRGGTWTVGIDFGTTSTTIYRHDGQELKPVELNKRLIQVTDSGIGRFGLYENFFSPNVEAPPFFSLLRISDEKQEHEGILHPLIDGHIYFTFSADSQESSTSDDENVDQQFRENMYYNQFIQSRENTKVIDYDLKWSAKAVKEFRNRLFLEQLCLQCAAEAVDAGAAGINWRFSYPTAFSDWDIRLQNQIWQRVVAECEKQTSESITCTYLPSQPESIVIAEFFSQPYFRNFESGAVCIDIGGATSDISIWLKNQLHSQTSLKFAGRDIFLNLFAFNPDIINRFKVDNSERDYQMMRSDGRKQNYEDLGALGYYARADTLLKHRSGQWLELYPTLLKQGEPFTGLLRLITMGVTGLLFYVKLLVKYLVQYENFESRSLDVFIGGRGSRILEWIENPLSEDMKKSIKEVSFGDLNLTLGDIIISENPKMEAAQGLVTIDNSSLKWPENCERTFLAGEPFAVGEEDFEWTKNLDPKLLGQEIKLTELENIDKFIENFYKFYQTFEGSTDSKASYNRELILADVETSLLNIRDEESNKRRVEPLFILALKGLLKQETEKWIERGNK